MGIDPKLQLETFNKIYPNSIKNRASFIENKSQLVEISDMYDFILIDGDHSFDGAVHDILKFTPMLERHGVLAIDDFDNFELPKAISELKKLGLVPFLQLQQTEFWHYPDQDRGEFLNNLLVDPISEFIFLYNIDVFGYTVLKAKTVRALTENIDLFDTMLKIYNV